MGNKEAIKIIESVTSEYKTYYTNNDLKSVNNLNKELLEVLNGMGKIPKNKQNNLKERILTYSLGNNKIGEDTLCISISCGLNCPMSILGECGNCQICYAKNQNKNYFKNTVPKNLINQNIINMVVLGEITLHEVLFNLISDIMVNISMPKIKNIKFLRFNVEGDILNNEILKVLDKLAYYLKTCFNLISCYTYTHNQNLNLDEVKNIVFNTSDFKQGKQKQVKTIFKLTSELLTEIKEGNIILCNGNCNNCPYCKDNTETREIYFLAHGGKYEGVEAYFNLISFLEANKEVDYMKFLIKNNEGVIYE